MGINNNTMNIECKNISKYFADFLANKTSEANTLSINKHLEKCVECKKKLTFLNDTLNTILKNDDFIVNPLLEQKILNFIENNTPIKKTPVRFLNFSVTIKAAAAIAALVIGTNTGIILGENYQEKKDNHNKIISIFAKDLLDNQEAPSNNILFAFLKNKQ
jgi:hypothetical protein